MRLGYVADTHRHDRPRTLEHAVREAEAEKLKALLAARADLSPVLELGSSTHAFRTSVKPHIDRLVHAPLRERGIRIVHADLKQGDGVDISGDIFDPDTMQQLKDVHARCVLCCNLLEHVEDVGGFAAVCDRVLAPGGVLVLSVPLSYPYHLDPIDNGFRSSPEQLHALFPTYTLEEGTIVEVGSYRDDVRRRGWHHLLSQVAKTLLLTGFPDVWKARAHRFLWLFRPYRISIAVLRKPHTSHPGN